MPTDKTPQTQRVTIVGPNLRLAGQKKGDLHIHAEGCSDIARDPRGYGYRMVEPHWTIEAASLRDIVETTYPPEDFGYDYDAEGDDYLASFYVAPCVHLPNDSQGGSA